VQKTEGSDVSDAPERIWIGGTHYSNVPKWWSTTADDVLPEYVSADLYDKLRLRLYKAQRTSYRRRAAIKQLTHAIDRRNRILNNLWDRVHEAEYERDDLATIIGGDKETGRAMWKAYHTVEAYKADNARLRAAIDQIEWSGHQRGQGSGPMSSGGDGPMVRSCPYCEGIDPSDRSSGDFIKSVHGHRPDCEIAAARGGTRRQQGGSVPPPTPTTLTAAGDLSGEYAARAVEELAILAEDD
jgi:hypothetical protein